MPSYWYDERRRKMFLLWIALILMDMYVIIQYIDRCLIELDCIILSRLDKLIIVPDTLYLIDEIDL